MTSAILAVIRDMELVPCPFTRYVVRDERGEFVSQLGWSFDAVAKLHPNGDYEPIPTMWDTIRLAWEATKKRQSQLLAIEEEVFGPYNPFKPDPDPALFTDPRILAIQPESQQLAQRLIRLEKMLQNEPADLHLEWFRKKLDKEDANPITPEQAFTERWPSLDYNDHAPTLPHQTTAQLDTEDRDARRVSGL